MTKGGVYCIINLKGGKMYIGSSKCLKSRLSGNKSALKRNTHHNEDLQKDWNELGETYFKFLVIHHCDTNFRELEREEIEKGFNLYNQSTPDDNLGTIAHSQQTKNKLRRISLEKEAQDPEKFRLARVRSVETLKKRYESGELVPFVGKQQKNNPKTSKVILAIKDDVIIEYVSINEAARQLNFKVSKIQDVLYGYVWKKYTTKKKGEIRKKINCPQHKGYVFKYKE
jgi:group I intron endonuclease